GFGSGLSYQGTGASRPARSGRWPAARSGFLSASAVVNVTEPMPSGPVIRRCTSSAQGAPPARAAARPAAVTITLWYSNPARNGVAGRGLPAPPDHLVQPPGGPVPEQVVAGHAGAVGHQVAQGHVAVGKLVSEMEVGQVTTDGVIPGQFPLVGELGQERGG